MYCNTLSHKTVALMKHASREIWPVVSLANKTVLSRQKILTYLALVPKSVFEVHKNWQTVLANKHYI